MMKKFSILGIILSVLLLVATGFLIYLINIFDVIPDYLYKYLLIALIGINVVLIFFMVIKINNGFFKTVRVIFYLITVIVLIGLTFGIIYLNKTINIFDKIGVIKEEITDYYIVVLKDSKYQEVEDLYEGKMAYYKNTDSRVINSIKLELDYKEIDDIDKLKDELFNKNVDSILISDIIMNKYTDEDEQFSEQVKIIKTISIKDKVEDITKKVSIKNKPFNVLISGIDTYGDIAKTSRNDVNIVATVNPNTNQILLTSIPRDYYVKLHGMEGYKDKLTHASYYGINTAVKTIEDILDIDINYYVKVNFTTVVDLVNKIGGVEVYADQDVYLSGCPAIKKGMNKLDGKCALAFSRERYSYADGDRHRGRNQQEVIRAIFTKLSSGFTLVTQYTDIIDSLDGKFATNMDMNDITSFIKYELNDLSGYSLVNTQLDGDGDMGPTYSYPNQDLWIMIPNQSTIDNAKNLINQVLDNKRIS